MIPRRQFLFASAGALALSACIRAEPQLGPDGQPLPVLYRIDPADTARIQFRVLDSVNSLRAAAGAPPLALNAELNAAAATHARDMAVQNRPWHFGSDGSSPIDRAQRAGYRGTVLGENISETYEAELETVAAWMTRPDTRDVITDPRGRDLGIAFYQEEAGKIWWTMLVGDGGTTGPANAPTG
ncbi:CAP domain-containing protein [Roseicyclus persicicus]|uniref:CAP domain-containing protein n=1 Tax=Roseicyclus persicicus TaxID=2650661 RepID=A0A7X6H1L6_9RHOB|nr:CAP domain-containing protein [Roseibacterium persicicum]NKX45161.1 CAP domain-containing protein [Roseibacterium persicicum]